MQTIGHFIDGQHSIVDTGRTLPVYNPATGETSAMLSIADSGLVARAVNSARKAQSAWGDTNPQQRARVMMAFAQLLNRDRERLAETISREHGKTLLDAKGDLQRGLEVVEFCIGAPHLLKGEYTHGAGRGIDLYALRQPLGVVAGITPFNFPAMIPLWKMAPALVAGNAFILKPSERVPSLPLMLADLLREAGLPNGVLHIVNGDKDTVNALIQHPDIAALSFVGSTPVAQSIYHQSAAHGKRVQTFGGAKNHMVIMPDADIDQAIDALIGAGYGAAGERCMAVSVAVPVGERTADRLVAGLAKRVQSLSVGPYVYGDKVDYGPLITKAAKQRVLGLIKSGCDQGAQLMVGDADFVVPNYENGFFVGPHLFDRVTTDMDIYKEEIFGPVLSVVRAKDYEHAVALVCDNPYGNGTAIFTRDGDTARNFVHRANIGMVGINVPIPVPLAYYTFGGWKQSAFGDLNQHGVDAFRFYTRTKTVTSRWPSGIKEGVALAIPTMDQ